MGRNLTGKTIQSTYEGLVQISGSILTDGTGSNIDYLTVTASYAANVTTPTLQSVTDAGNTTTNYISSSEGLIIGPQSTIYPTTPIQVTGLENEPPVYFVSERGGTYQIRMISSTATNGIFLNQSGSQNVRIDFNNSPGEIQSEGTLTLNPNHTLTGGIIFASAPVSSSYGFTGSLSGNATTATSASYAVTASYADNVGSVTLQQVLNTGNVADGVDIILSGSYLIHSASYSGNVIDNLTTPTASEAINHVVFLTQAEYNALTPDDNTLYVISGSSVIAADTLQQVLDAGNTATQDMTLVGSITATSFTGSLNGNADTATSASYALTASFAENAAPTFPYTGSAIISGSLSITGSQSIDSQDDTADSFVVKGGRVSLSSGNYDDTVWFNVGNSNNSFTTTDKSPVMSLGASITNQSAAHGVAFGESHTIQSSGYNTFIGGGNGNQIQGQNKVAIIAGTSNTINGGVDGVIVGGSGNTLSHNRSVVIGGSSLASTADDQVVVPTLLISGSGGGVTFPDGTSQTTAAGGGATFPYTGSAIISGSLEVTGSVSGLLADNEGISIFASASANSTNGLILIGAQIPSQNGYNTNIGVGNIVIGSGEFLADKHGVLDGAEYYNVVIGGYSGGVNRGRYGTVIGGGNNFIGVSGSAVGNSVTTYNAIVGGENHVIEDRATYNGIFAGRNNKMAPIGTNSNQYSTLIGGQGNHISSSDYSSIIGGNSHQMEFANYSGILAGNNHTFTYALNTSAYSAMVGGNGNTNAHVRSVVLGGTGLSTTKNDQVLVPHLTISGSVTAGVYAITPASATGSMDCSLGNFFTMTLDNGTDVRLEASNLTAGQTINLKLTNNATAAGTISFDTAVFKFEGGTPFTATAATNAVDVMTFISFDGSTLQATGLKNFS